MLDRITAAVVSSPRPGVIEHDHALFMRSSPPGGCEAHMSPLCAGPHQLQAASSNPS